MRSAHFILLAGALALSGCGKGGGAAAGTGAGGGSAAAASGGCSAFTAGSNGVIRTFCDGTGSVALSVDGQSRTLKGGSCEQQGPMFSFNAGVVTGPGAKAPYPDYVGLTLQGSGAFSDAVLPVHLDGKSYIVRPNQGEASTKGGSFSGTGTPVGGGAPVKISGTFTC